MTLGWRVSLLAVWAVTSNCSDSQKPPSGRAALPPRQSSASIGAHSTHHELDSIIAQGESVYLRGSFDTAQRLWSGALDRIRTTQDSAREARVLTWLGLTAYRRGDYSRARSLGEQALALKLRVRLTDDLSRSYNALGLLAWNEGRLSEATTLLELASETAGAARDEAGLAKAANNLALVHIELGNFAEARSGFLQTRASAVRLRDPRIEGGALTNLGMLDVQLGDPRAAIASLSEARRLYRSINYETGEQNALGQLGTAYDALGEPRLALAALDSALAIARKEGLKQEEASNLELIASVYRQAGDFRRALDLYQQANVLNGELGLIVEQGANLRSVAEIHAALGRSDLAQEFATRALRLHRRVGARLQELRDNLLLAELAATVGAAQDASAHLGAATILAAMIDARVPRAEVALGRAAILVRQGHGRAAIRSLAAAEAEIALGDYATVFQAATLRARAYLQVARLDSAALSAQAAVAAVERVRGNFGSGFLRLSYGTDKSAVYADLIDVLLRQGRSGEAFEVADRARSRVLLEHLGAASDGFALPSAAGAFAEGELILRRIDTLTSRLDALEETPRAKRDSALVGQMKALAAELMRARGDYESRLVRAVELDGPGATLLGGRQVSALEIQRVLGSGEVVLEYLVTSQRVVLFIVTRDSVGSVSVPIPIDDLSRRVRLARDLIAQPSGRLESYSGVLSGLYDVLVAPAERAGALAGARRLIIIPHSVLAYLPFAALRRAGDGHYLMQDYVLLNLPSAAALPMLRNRESSGPDQSSGTPLVFVPFPDALPGSDLEGQAFRRAVSGAETRRGSRATESDFRFALGDGSLIHVATHGVMNSRNSLFSRIELTPGSGRPEDDGRLEVHELLRLRIQSPLVFLSGCETGVGAAWSNQFARGEDYATLAQAFLYAGARNVMATLWRIEDQGAAAFAQRFYAHLATEAPADALAAGQRDLLQTVDYAGPFYWAAYQLSGAGQAVFDSHTATAVSVQ
jgi:CHAT domain-containing protein/tetratricopeptide (TPR) repeat protein